MKILTFFVFAGLAAAQDKLVPRPLATANADCSVANGCLIKVSDSLTNSTSQATLSKTDLLAIDSIAQRAAAVDRDKQELITEICSKISVSVENCSIDVEKRTVSTKPIVKPESAPLRTPVK